MDPSGRADESKSTANRYLNLVITTEANITLIEVTASVTAANTAKTNKEKSVRRNGTSHPGKHKPVMREKREKHNQNVLICCRPRCRHTWWYAAVGELFSEWYRHIFFSLLVVAHCTI